MRFVEFRRLNQHCDFVRLGHTAARKEPATAVTKPYLEDKEIPEGVCTLTGDSFELWHGTIKRPATCPIADLTSDRCEKITKYDPAKVRNAYTIVQNWTDIRDILADPVVQPTP